jgi:hypothetical protein
VLGGEGRADDVLLHTALLLEFCMSHFGNRFFERFVKHEETVEQLLVMLDAASHLGASRRTAALDACVTVLQQVYEFHEEARAWLSTKRGPRRLLHAAVRRDAAPQVMRPALRLLTEICRHPTLARKNITALRTSQARDLVLIAFLDGESESGSRADIRLAAAEFLSCLCDARKIAHTLSFVPGELQKCRIAGSMGQSWGEGFEKRLREEIQLGPGHIGWREALPALQMCSMLALVPRNRDALSSMLAHIFKVRRTDAAVLCPVFARTPPWDPRL